MAPTALRIKSRLLSLAPLALRTKQHVVKSLRAGLGWGLEEEGKRPRREGYSNTMKHPCLANSWMGKREGSFWTTGPRQALPFAITSALSLCTGAEYWE